MTKIIVINDNEHYVLQLNLLKYMCDLKTLSSYIYIQNIHTFVILDMMYCLKKNWQEDCLKEASFLLNNSYDTDCREAGFLLNNSYDTDCREAGFLLNNSQVTDCREAGFLLNNSHSIEVGALVVTSHDTMKLTLLVLKLDIEVGALVVTSHDTMKLTLLALKLDIEVGALVVTSHDTMKLAQLALDFDTEVGALVVTSHDTMKLALLALKLDIEVGALVVTSHDTMKLTLLALNIDIEVGALVVTSHDNMKLAQLALNIDIEVGTLVVTSHGTMKLAQFALNIDIEVGTLVLTSHDTMKLAQLALNIDVEVGALVVTSHGTMKLTQLALNIDIEVGALVVTSHDTMKLTLLAFNIDIEVGALVVTSHNNMKLAQLALNIDVEVGALVVTSHGTMKLTQLALNIDIEVGALVVTSQDTMKLTKLALNIDIEVGAIIVTNHKTMKLTKLSMNIDLKVCTLVVANHDTVNLQFPMNIDIEVDTLVDASHDTVRNTKHGMNIQVKVGALTDTSHGSVKVAKHDGKYIKDIVQVANDTFNFILKKSVKDRCFTLCRRLCKISLEPRARYRKHISYKRCEHTGEVESDTSCLLYKMILLLLGGDIETNPGPRQKKASYDKRKREERDRKRKEREQETSDAKKKRLETQKCRSSANRMSETLEQTAKRIQEQKYRTAHKRESETQENTNKRRKQDRDFKAKARALETPEQTLQRNLVQKSRTTANRESETPEQTAQRILAQKTRTTANRESETTEQSAQRILAQRSRTTANRESEMPERTAQRILAQKTRTTANRESETPEQTAQRILAQKTRTTANRESETTEQSAQRILAQRSRTTANRESETPERTAQRILAQKTRTTANRESETTEQTAQRILAQRSRTTANRESETTEQSAQRILAQRTRTTANRESETPEQTAQRILAQRTRTTANRESETPEQTAQRILAQRTRTTANRESETTDQTAQRILAQRTRTTANRESETPEKTAQRILEQKTRTAAKRESETTEQTAHRILEQKRRTTANRESETTEETAKRRKLEKNRIYQSRSNSDLTEITKLFQEKIKSGPDFVCTCCHRMMYKPNVRPYHKGKFPKLTEEQRAVILEAFMYTSTDGRTWICVTCDRSLQKGNMPRQAKANGLGLFDIPPELSQLNEVEIRLLSRRIPFMKIVALPKGKQKAIHGPAVNVPTQLDTICNLLPRLPNECEIIPMKLKRRLCYKSYYMYDSIHPQKIIDALKWLIQNNKHYYDVKLNNNWAHEYNDNDPELWEALTGLKSKLEVPDKNKKVVPLEIPNTNPLIKSKPSVISNSFAHLDELCTAEGYSIENVKGDGNCFYHAVEKQLKHCNIHSGEHSDYLKLRKSLCNYLETNPNGPTGNIPYKQFLANRAIRGDSECETIKDQYIEQVQDETDREELRWQRYLQDMEEGSWADHIAVQGMADMLHVAIRIIATLNPDTPLIKPRDGLINGMLHLGLIGELHYVSLIRTTSTQEVEIIETVCNSPEQNHKSLIQMQKNETDDEQTKCNSISTQSNTIDEEEYEYQRDSKAFEISSKLRGLPLDTCLQLESIDANKIISVAPGEGAKPLNILTDQLFEEMSFPHKYPNGKGGFSQERKEKITVRKFFNQRLLDVDGRFAKDVEYLLAAQYAVEHDQVDNLQSIVIRQMKGRHFQGQKITAGDLKNPEKLNQLVQKDYAYRILKDIRGTPAYWQKVHYEVLAMIRQLGIPTWFLTLSAADMKWPEVIQIIARQYGTILTDEQVSSLSWEEKCSWLRRNPITAARHFQYRLDLFWNDFLKSKAMPIGEVVDFMIRIEFQARGSPHAHTIVWIKDAPKFGTDRVEEVVEFIDKYQTCAIPDNDAELHDLVQLQSHVHSSSCMRKGSCRFHIPKLPSPTTLISTEPQDEQDKAVKVKRANDIFKQINDKIMEIHSFENVTLEQLLQFSNVSMKDYMEALHTSKRGNTVVLKRQPTEMNINNYNPAILKAWKANMDIQYILDAYACVMYVTSYMMKSERAMGELLRHVSKECSGEDIRTQLRKLGTTFLNHREVSAQEASFRILSMPMKKLSRKCVFINTSPQNERVTMTKPLASIQELENDEEDVYLINLIDRYAARPDQLENMCLAEFAANYDVKYSKTSDEENDHTPKPLQQEKAQQRISINLKDGLGKMQKRSREAIIRFPKHNIEKDSEKYYRAKLMLYYPWRQENNIIGGSASYCDQYRNCLEDITENAQHYTQNGLSFEEAMQDLNEFGPPVHAFANVAPGVEQQNIEDEQEGNVEERHLEQQDLDENAELMMAKVDKGIGQRFDTQTDTNLMSSAEYCKKMRQLNKEQQNIVQYHRKWCKNVIQAARHNKPVPKAYKVFISGPGGVGKSHVIDLLKNDTYRLLRHLPSVHPHDVLSLVCAPTGTAAFNISGMTIHSTFFIPVAMKQYRTIGADTLNTLRNKLNNLKVVIIDEISMVGSHLLYQIHRRLEEIKGSNSQDSTFGDVTIIAVGDLYQLPPVGKAYVFDHPDDSYAKLQDPLWYQFKLAELTQIMRQKDDAVFAQLLNRVRTATCSKDDIALLRSREISPDMKNYPIDTLHVYSTHKLVNEHNSKMLSKIHETIHTVKAIDSKKDRNSGIDVKFPEKVSETGGLETSLKVAIGCRVMLTYNLDVTDGLSNGATGTVSHIVILADNVVNILVEFDDPKIGVKAKRLSQYRQNYPNSVPISRHEASFNIGVRKCINASRRQFPLRLSWASTIHKVQGLTTDSIVVSFEGRFFPGQAYVALSRVRHLDGLHILKFDPAQIHVDCAVVREMERLHENPIVANTEAVNPELFNLQVSHLNIRGIKSHKDISKLVYWYMWPVYVTCLM